MANESPTRRAFLATAAATALAGCSGTSGREATTSTVTPADAADTPGDTTTQTTAETSGIEPPLTIDTLPLPMEPSAFDEHVVSGGPPKDGIPAIEDPSFESAAEAGNRLASSEIVFGVERNGEAKAYPQYILVWHEICNDQLGGDAVSITYCPLTGTVLGFERGDTSFGVSGRLVNNNLIMYDRGTEQWWPQVLSTSIPSPWHEPYRTRSLQDFRVVWTSWGDWRELYPDTLVLTEDTGNLRNYDDDPYGDYENGERFGYYAPPRPPMFSPLSESDRFEPKRVVIGARAPGGAVAFLKDSLREQGQLSGTLADTPVLAVYDPRLDTGYVYRNPDRLQSQSRDDRYVDEQGEDYQPDALPLDHVHAFDAMWFAWHGFYPDTEVYD